MNATKSEGEHNLFNTCIAAKPHHPIMKGCIDRITLQVLGNMRPSSLLDLAGPGVLGRSFNSYMGRPETASVLGMEGSHLDGKILLLQFLPGIEYVRIKDADILFQNKNGNSSIKNVYESEAANNHIISWLCSEPWSTE
jgi:hypothetical protein